MSTRLVKLMATGGTIATVTDAETGRSRPARQAGDFALRADNDVQIETEDLSLAASWSLDAIQMLRIGRAATAAAASGRYVGVVVTHGTTTLEYTAFLTEMLLDAETPVVFTGSMRRADASDSDGPRNLQDAIRVAVAPASRRQGVLVCFHGQILSARDVWKKDRSALDAFIGLSGPVGMVDGDVHFLRARRPHRTFGQDLDPAVAMVKAYPGADGDQLEAALAGGARGIVVEGLPGAGGIPAAMQPALRNAAARGIPVVISSRAPVGRIAAEPTGGTGEPLQGLGLISAGDLSTEQAWVLLMLALGEVTSIAGVKAIFDDVTAVREDE